MLHLLARKELGKEYDDRKTRKLVKKLVKQQEKNWDAEQQRRLEQEEKDAAFARELQQQLDSDEHSTHSYDVYAVTSPPSSPMNGYVGSPRISSSPPPLPAKPIAYNSHSGYSSSSSSVNSNNTDQHWAPYNNISSSSPALQHANPFQNSQPPLPPRQKTVSQLSQYSSSITHQHVSYAAPNPAAGVETGHQPYYYSGTTQPIQHRDPAMMIIPPPLNENHTALYPHSICSSSSIMSMPEPEPEFARNTSFQHYPPYNTLVGSTPPPSHGHPMYIPAPIASSSNSYHYLQGDTTSSMLNGTTISAASSSSAPEPPHSLPPIVMKPDAKPDAKPDEKPENEEKRDSTPRFTTTRSNNSISLPQSTTCKVTLTEDSDDDDDNGSMFWACNDGRMMASTPPSGSSTTTHANTSTNREDKHKVSTSARKYDDGKSDDSGSEFEDDGGEDTAIDPFDIMNGDKVIIYQHNNTNTSSSKSSIHSVGDNNNHNTTTSDDGNPFADSFAVDSTTATHHQPQSLFQAPENSIHFPSTTYPAPTLPWNSSQFASSSVSMLTAAPPSPSPSLRAILSRPRPASVHQYPFNENNSSNIPISLDNKNNVQHVMPINVRSADAPSNIQHMKNQVTAEVPSHEFGYYQEQASQAGSEKEEIDDVLLKNGFKLPKFHPDHRHITVPSVVKNERVWIRVHPTDTGKSLATRIHIVGTYKTRKILSIKTDKGRLIPQDDIPVFQDWADVMELENGAPWQVEWTTMDCNHPWEGPKEF